MTKGSDTQLDDYDAVKRVVVILQPFADPDRERIIRWTREKLGMVPAPSVGSTPPPGPSGGAGSAGTPGGGVSTPPASDIKSFITAKAPKNGTQLAATVAYFNRFLAREGEKKETINAEDLLEACRKADWDRPAVPAQTLINAFSEGVFDKVGRGSYALNTVGENLVAMVLPAKEGEVAKVKASRRRGRTKPTARSTGSSRAKKTAKKAGRKTAKRSRK